MNYYRYLSWLETTVITRLNWLYMEGEKSDAPFVWKAFALDGRRAISVRGTHHRSQLGRGWFVSRARWMQWESNTDLGSGSALVTEFQLGKTMNCSAVGLVLDSQACSRHSWFTVYVAFLIAFFQGGNMIEVANIFTKFMCAVGIYMRFKLRLKPFAVT